MLRRHLPARSAHRQRQRGTGRQDAGQLDPLDSLKKENCEPMTETDHQGASYAAAGVDIEAGDRAVELFAPLAKKATRPEVRGGLGGFAGLFALGKYKEPHLAAGSD